MSTRVTAALRRVPASLEVDPFQVIDSALAEFPECTEGLQLLREEWLTACLENADYSPRASLRDVLADIAHAVLTRGGEYAQAA